MQRGLGISEDCGGATSVATVFAVGISSFGCSPIPYVPHGDIATLTGFGIHVLPFRDPDNIQIELTAPIC